MTPLATAPVLLQLKRLEEDLRQAVRSSSDAVRSVLIALLADGHVLIEDVPGVGKTTLAQALARGVEGRFQRIQFTSDLLPSDVLGVTIYQQSSERFHFKPGPVFANVLLADEINRTTPKTQSALLEAMNERHVTVDETTHPLPKPFLVIATQNPVEHHGTFPLPEAQLDRFLLCVRMGYPQREDERAILRGEAGAGRLEQMVPVLGCEEIVELQEMARGVNVDETVVGYELDLVAATRQHPGLSLGVSPRGTLALHRAAQARALLEGRAFVTPEDVQRLLQPVWAHRIETHRHLGARQGEQAQAMLEEIRMSVPVPR